MKKINLSNITLMAAVTSYFLQFGAQLFALTIIASTVVEAPPRSFALFEGEYGYNSSAFWDTVPPITFLLIVITLGTNWKNRRRKPVLFALFLFIIAGLIAGFYLEPMFAEMIALGYSDEVDPILQSRVAKWYVLDWIVWGIGIIGGVALLVALARQTKLIVETHKTEL